MGMSTRLYLSNRWNIEDVKDIIESRFKTVVKVESTSSLGLYIFNFKVKTDRSMHVHSSINTPLGSCIMLSLGCNEEAVEIMTAIAETLGGYLEENDCDETGKMIDGEMSDENGLSYFVKYAIVHDNIDSSGNSDSLLDLKNSVDFWNDRIYGSKKELE